MFNQSNTGASNTSVWNRFNPYGYDNGTTRAPAPAPVAAPQAAPIMPLPAALTNPFSSAISGGQSGGQSGTLQPFINRNTQLANDALYGGLLNQAPQNLVSGDAGGTAINPTPPNQAQFGLLGMNKQPMFGNRAWLEA